MSHKIIMDKARKALESDALRYAKDSKKTSSQVKKKHDAVEKKEAMSAAKDLKKRAKSAHEY